ncbi:MAG: PQQ-binding-like beta-propeller repeat protein [Actinomycetota bacterium]
MSKRRVLIGGALALLAVAAVAGVYVYNQLQPTEMRGSAAREFVPEAGPEKTKKPRLGVPWPTYAYDQQRSHVAAGFRHRPPYRRIWRFDAGDTVEYPPSVGYGNVYVPQQRGDFFAVNGKTGKVVWKKDFKRCAAASPTIAKGVVYQAYMDFSKCPQDRPGADGFVVAMNAKTGKERWRFKAGPVESSPVLVNGILYFGSWDNRVYAVKASNGKKVWSFQADEQVNTGAAYAAGRIVIGTDAGSLYALGAKDGRLIWRAQSNSTFGSREFFYATPTIAYGRVYIGNTDGTMYAYGLKSGNLLWARPSGTYIYSAAAVDDRKVYFGTYDGNFYALDAATGDVRWKQPAPSSVHAAPTVMNGLVYYSTCDGCGTTGVRSVKVGPRGTFGLSVKNGKLMWKSKVGKLASPIVADRERVYLIGQSSVHALVERKR